MGETDGDEASEGGLRASLLRPGLSSSGILRGKRSSARALDGLRDSPPSLPSGDPPALESGEPRDDTRDALAALPLGETPAARLW